MVRMSEVPGIPGSIGRLPSGYQFSKGSITLYRQKPSNFKMVRVRGAEADLSKVFIGAKLIGYTQPEEGGIFYGIFRREELIGIGFESEGKTSNFQFDKRGEVKPLNSLSGLNPRGIFIVVWEAKEGPQGGLFQGDKIVALIAEAVKDKK